MTFDQQRSWQSASGKPLLLGLAWLSGVVFAVAILSFVYLGTFTRVMADDFCGAVEVSTLGFWGNLKDAYFTWDGRFASDLINEIAEKAGPKLVPVLPAMLLFSWIAALTLTIREIGKCLGWSSNALVSLLFSELTIYAVLSSTPNAMQSFHWQTGLVVYALPLVLMTVYIGILFWAKNAIGTKQHVLIALSAIIVFIAGGCSETYTAMQFGGLLIVTALAPKLLKVEKKLIVPGLIASCLSFVLVATAPGNAARQYFNPFQRDLPHQFSSALLYSFYFVYRFVWEHRLTFVLCILMAAIIGFVLDNRRKEQQPAKVSTGVFELLVWNIAGYLVVLASVVPAYYGMGSRPPDRAMVNAQFVLVLATICWGYLIGVALRNAKHSTFATPILLGGLSLGIAVLLVLEPVNYSRRTLASIATARVYAEEWDRQDLMIRHSRSKGIKDLVLRPLPAWNYAALEAPGPNPKVGFNTCIAKYYGLDSIAYRPEP